MGIGDCVELLTTKYSLFEGQSCRVTGESRDGRRWLVETGEQISKDREGEDWAWRLGPRHAELQNGEVFLWPSQIGFTQNSINSCFQDGRSLKESYLDQLEFVSSGGKRRRRCGPDIPPIEVVFVHGRYYSLANRRLAVYRLLEMGDFLRDPIKAILVESESLKVKHKFTTKCDGEWVALRGANSQWIGRTVHETNCWLHTTKLGAPEQLVYHQEEGLGQILGDANDNDWGDVSVKFQHSTQDVFLDELTLHGPLMTLCHKRNFMARARHLGIWLCQNMCSCGCGEICGARVCVCGCCDTPYHNAGKYCCDCAKKLGLDLGQFQENDEAGDHLHAGHAGCDQSCSSSSEE